MEKIQGFCDLCVPYNKNHKELIELLNEHIELGYKNVAIEQIYDDIEAKKPEKGKRPSDQFPVPVSLKFLEEEFDGKLKFFSRLTIIYMDQGITHPMSQSQNLKKFNIIAGMPTTETSLQHCCSTFNGDIISFSPDHTQMLNRKYYGLAIRRGMYFELKYSPAIVNSTDRKKIISRGHYYHAIGKSKNVLLNSGAENRFELRSPYDVANLGLIFGLSEEQGKSAVQTLSRSLLIKAEARRHGKTVMFVKQVAMSEDESEEDESSDNMENSDEDMDVNPTKRVKTN